MINKGITHTKERTVVIIITSNRKGPIVDVSFTHITISMASSYLSNM